VVVLDIEMEGVKQIRAHGMPARFVFVAPPSADELERRLRGRGTEKEDSIRKRLEQSRREMDYSATPGVHDRILVNDDLERAYAELDAFIYAAPAAAADA
jgi:guanylate kinase